MSRRIEVGYPQGRARVVRQMGRWMRRVGVAVAVASSTAFWIGCFGTGGEAPYPDYFYESCEDNDPTPEPDFQAPGSFSRYLCPGQSTWLELAIDEQAVLDFDLEDASSSSSSDVRAVIADPGGVVVGSLDRAHPSLQLGLTPGTWRVTVTQTSDEAEGDFVLYLDE